MNNILQVNKMITAKEALELSKVKPVDKIMEELERMIQSACDGGYSQMVLKGEEWRNVIVLIRGFGGHSFTVKEVETYKEVIDILQTAGFKLEQHWERRGHMWCSNDICLKISWSDN